MKKLALLITASLGLAFAAKAQDSVSFISTIVAPNAGTNLSCNDSIQFQVKVINNGPTKIDAGDSVLIVAPHSNKGQGFKLSFSQTADFNVGDSTLVNFKIHQSQLKQWIQLDPANTNSGTLKYVEDGAIIPNDSIGLGFRMSTAASDTKYTISSENQWYFSKFYYGCGTNTGVNEIAKTALNVYPNPTSAAINFTHNFAKATTATVKVLDLMGRTVLVEQYDVNAGAKNFNLNVADLANGSYFVELTTSEEKGITKFTIAK